MFVEAFISLHNVFFSFFFFLYFFMLQTFLSCLAIIGLLLFKSEVLKSVCVSKVS